jgi:methyl-accepting chemotaxis protein II, aspartate sensor receptor
MEWHRRFTIAARLNTAMFAVAAALLTLGISTFAVLRSGQQDFRNFTLVHLPRLLAIHQTRESLGAVISRDEVEVVMGYALPDEAARLAARLTEPLDRALTQMQPLLGSTGTEAASMPANARAAALQVSDLLTAYRAQVVPVFEAAASGRLTSVAQGKQSLIGAREKLQDAAERLKQISQETEATTARLAADTEQRQSHYASALLLAVLLVLALLLPLLWGVLRSILRPLVHARDAALRVASGDLGGSIVTKGRDEIAELMHALAAMQRSLRDAVSGIRDGAVCVSAAAGHIAADNGTLLHGAAAAGAALKQSSGQIASLASALSQSAQDAVQAGERARQTAGHAHDSEQQMGSLLRQMQTISQTSTRIGEIIGVVNDIATQTNILALNAGVEAARAGDQGRGFAVVAQEIRALANKVSTAAYEIKVLINSASDSSQQGAQQAQSAFQTVLQTQEAVNSLSHEMTILAESMRFHSHQLADLRSALCAVDAMTQQNTDRLSATDASARSLSTEAQKLEALVGSFRL